MEPFAECTEQLRADLEGDDRNAEVGTALLLEDDRARYRELRIVPGERVGFHRHVLDYVWTCVAVASP